MGIFDDMVRKMVQEEMGKAAPAAPDTPETPAATPAAQPEAAPTEPDQSINQPATGSPEPSQEPKNNADTITISTANLESVIAKAVKEGSAAALMSRSSGATPEPISGQLAMARICGLVERK